MVPKQAKFAKFSRNRFRAVLFRMVPKRKVIKPTKKRSFRAVLFRMVPKLIAKARNQGVRF